jgi:uncharacterized protein YcnI
MRRILIPAILAALLVVPSAASHVTVTPTRVEPGADVLLTFVVPNETEDDVITAISIEPPAAFEYEAVQAPPGWQRGGGEASIDWTGGAIQPGNFVTFSLSGSADKEGTEQFRVIERYRSGKAAQYHPEVSVAPAPAAARDSSAHTLGKAALFVALAAGAIAVGAFFLALALWLRGPRDAAP